MYVCSMYGLCTACVPYVYSMCTVGICMVITRYVYGMCTVCVQFVYSMCKICQFTVMCDMHLSMAYENKSLLGVSL